MEYNHLQHEVQQNEHDALPERVQQQTYNCYQQVHDSEADSDDLDHGHQQLQKARQVQLHYAKEASGHSLPLRRR